MTAAEPVPAAMARVAIIGAGQAGRRFALRCALAGYAVVLEDVMPANLRRAQAEFSDLVADLGADRAGQPGPGSLELALTVEDAVRDADIAIDFVPDELESKLEIFCLIDRMAPPRTILCTPSEALSITDLASCTYRADRCFAVRGGLGEGDGGVLRLLYPKMADAGALSRVRELLAALGRAIAVELDADEPMLVKNAALG
ncbi:MAG TPA: 3-hydroxyacyl-CoA dehydrogenase NAD-binding domain-containing protein [Granulicella sp.]|jgi:3-hydroxybutyryl-CoA dehydrogenase|nr:3-hydroxyacyl-CoA dehydrogenase NAD-binding domain-containing protein [Granulicella sp.]